MISEKPKFEVKSSNKNELVFDYRNITQDCINDSSKSSNLRSNNSYKLRTKRSEKLKIIKPYMNYNTSKTRKQHLDKVNRNIVVDICNIAKSDDNVFNKLSTDFQNILKNVQTSESVNGKVDYNEFVQIMFQLGFIIPLNNQYEFELSEYEANLMLKIWKHLKGHHNKYIGIKDLKLYLTAIMNLKFDWMVKPQGKIFS